MEDSLDYSDNYKIYLRDVRKIPLLTEDEERDLSDRIHCGDMVAKDQLVEHNLRLVIDIAKHYINRGLSFEDLIEEGNIGLVEAAQRFDSVLGKFSTYAVIRIRKNILRAIYNKGRAIRIPVYFYTKINNYKTALRELTELLRRDPSLKEIAQKMNISEEEVLQIVKNMYEIESLDKMAFADSEKDLISFIGENDKDDLGLRKLINKVLSNSSLTRRERFVIFKYFGFIDNKCYTLDEIAQMLHVSYEMIRIIKNNALGKMRNNGQSDDLANYTQKPMLSQIKLHNYRETGNMDLSERELLLRELNDYSELYEYFSDYSREEINKALNDLSNNELETLCKHLRDKLYYGRSCRNVLNKIRIGLKLQRNDQYDNLDEYEMLLKVMDNPDLLSDLEKQIVSFKIGALPNVHIAKLMNISEKDVEEVIKNLSSRVRNRRA